MTFQNITKDHDIYIYKLNKQITIINTVTYPICTTNIIILNFATYLMQL